MITVIEKKGKDRPLLEKWRPISLVNVDAKIISKVLATRIKNVLVGKDTVPQYWKLCYQQWSRNWLFSLERGVRQGSPYLFVVAVETLALAIRQNTEITGIKFGGEETKLLQWYADDTTTVLSDIDSARALFNLLEVFKNLSGLVTNWPKTEGMWIGSSRDKTSKPFGIKWPDEPIKAHGVYSSDDIKVLNKKKLLRDWTVLKNS